MLKTWKAKSWKRESEKLGFHQNRVAGLRSR